MSQNIPPQNHLLSTLSRPDFELLEPHLTQTTLVVRRIVEEPGKPILEIHFPDNGILSVVNTNLRDHPIEVGIIGSEGMSGIAVVMGNDRAPHQTYVQVAGDGRQMGADALRDAMQISATLRISLLHFAQAFMIQIAQTASANGRAKVEERLARWLLMSHDRMEGDELALTHEFLALMLGVRRAGVTVAFRQLEQKALVRTRRGLILVEDREGLEELAGKFYGVAEAEYARLTGWPTKH